MADLKGGTSGQILSKASNTDMDFTWITNDVGDITAVNVTAPITGGGTSGAVTIGVDAASTSAAGVVQLSDSTSTTSSVLASTPTATKSAYDLAAAAVPKSTVTTAGDVIYATGSSAVTRLGIGSTGNVLTVAGGVPTWAAPASTTPTFVGCSLYKSANQSIASATTTTLSFDSEVFDTDGFHDNVTNNDRITIPTGKAGKYLFTIIVYWGTSNTTGVREIQLAKAGNPLIFDSITPAASGNVSHVTFIASAAVGDVFTAKVYQSATISLNVLGGQTYYTAFQAAYLGA
jgi:hypothetical protein